MPLPSFGGGGGGLSTAQANTAATGDYRSDAAAGFYFSSPFSVGSGKATSDQSGAGTGTEGMDFGIVSQIAVAAVVVVGLIVAARVLRE